MRLYHGSNIAIDNINHVQTIQGFWSGILSDGY